MDSLVPTFLALLIGVVIFLVLAFIALLIGVVSFLPLLDMKDGADTLITFFAEPGTGIFIPKFLLVLADGLGVVGFLVGFFLGSDFWLWIGWGAIFLGILAVTGGW